MPLKTETKKCGSVEVTTTQLPPMRSFKLLSRVSKVIGPALEMLATMDGAANAMPLFGAVLGSLSEHDSSSLILEVFCSTTVVVDGRMRSLDSQAAVDAAFMGDLSGMMTALVFVLKVNFGDFFSAALGSDQAPGAALP